MINSARILMFAIVLTLVGLGGALLAPEDASANRLRGGGGGNRGVHVTHFQPQRSRQSFRPSAQSRPRVVSRPSVNRRVSSSRQGFRPRVARQSSSTNHRFGTGSFGRPRTFGSGGSSRPTKLSHVQRTGAFGHLSQSRNDKTSLRQPRLVERQTGNQTFNINHLPKPNSIGSTKNIGNTVAHRPFNLANLPRPNSLGGSHGTPNAIEGSHASANNGIARPFNLANLPKPNSLRNAPERNAFGGSRDNGNKGTSHPFTLASLPKPNSIGGTHVANSGTHPEGIASQHANTHDLTKKTSTEGAVIASSEKVGGDKEQLKGDKDKSATDEKKVKTDTIAANKAKSDLDAASKAAVSAQNTLNAAQKGNAPKAIIASDAEAFKNAQSKLLKADTTALNDNSKLAADKNAAATDKKNVSADQKVLKQDKATLSDKEKIAKQANEISKLKKAENSNDQASDGQGSSNQSADNGQNSSNDGGNNQTTSSNSGGGSNSNGSTGNNDVSRNATVIDNSTHGTTVATSATSVARNTALAVRLPASAPAPQQIAAVAPTDADPATTPTFVMIVFQKDVSTEDIAAFLKAYDASIADGPNADGLYKVQLSEQVPADQFQQVLDSIKSQTNVVLSAAPN